MLDSWADVDVVDPPLLGCLGCLCLTGWLLPIWCQAQAQKKSPVWSYASSIFYIMCCHACVLCVCAVGAWWGCCLLVLLRIPPFLSPRRLLPFHLMQGSCLSWPVLCGEWACWFAPPPLASSIRRKTATRRNRYHKAEHLERKTKGSQRDSRLAITAPKLPLTPSKDAFCPVFPDGVDHALRFAFEGFGKNRPRVSGADI